MTATRTSAVPAAVHDATSSPARSFGSEKPAVNLLELLPDEVVDLALAVLKEARTAFVEQRSRLYRRMGVPVPVKNYSFAVEDDDLAPVSQILEGLGLPRSPPPTHLGDYTTKTICHRITATQSPAFARYIVLIPSSFGDLNLSEASESPSEFQTRSPPRCLFIPVPPPPVVYASLMRAMTRYQPRSQTWVALASDLQQLIDYHLLGEHDGYVDPADTAAHDTREVQGQRARAVAVVHDWIFAHAWRPGEEWIGDALVGIMLGQADIEHLPSA